VSEAYQSRMVIRSHWPGFFVLGGARWWQPIGLSGGRLSGAVVGIAAVAAWRPARRRTRLCSITARCPDHKGMTVRPPSGIPLPELVLVANRVLAEEAEAVRAALEDFSNAPQPGCPWELDGKAISDQVGQEAHGRAELLRYARHQAVLIYVNAYDHLL